MRWPAIFLLFTFLGYAFGLMLYRSIYKILALALFGAFIGILSNALRVWAIVWIDWVQGSQMPLTAHGNIQWVALLICLGLMFFVIGKLDEEKDTKNREIAMPTSDCHSRQWAPVLAGFSVFIISGGLDGCYQIAHRHRTLYPLCRCLGPY
ncbi:MAG: exosortase/archaeosortase family protein [Dechloromonas sp.]|nr:MAG: exosortase/archaeosortase family protein [Dechloromonas sp.]